MRLTEKINNYYTCDYSLAENVCGKLGKLEDIEEEIGIDLIILFKALKNGIYVKEENEIKFVHNIFTNGGIIYEVIFEELFDFYFFGDYGKTWALTKEELER